MEVEVDAEEEEGGTNLTYRWFAWTNKLHLWQAVARAKATRLCSICTENEAASDREELAMCVPRGVWMCGEYTLPWAERRSKQREEMNGQCETNSGPMKGGEPRRQGWGVRWC